jgi:hypothetical protein
VHFSIVLQAALVVHRPTEHSSADREDPSLSSVSSPAWSTNSTTHSCAFPLNLSLAFSARGVSPNVLRQRYAHNM